MNSLKKSIMGKYNAEDVDKLLQKVRNDYELCLKEQKERIVALREDNRKKASCIEAYKENEKYIVSAITKAEETAQSILDDAEDKAQKRLDLSKREIARIGAAVQSSYQRLHKLSRASEAIARSVASLLAEYESAGNEAEAIHIKPVKKLY